MASDTRRRITVTVNNKLGMHARPAMAFVDVANQYQAHVTVHRDDQAVDGKSIMQMMMLAATQGTELDIEAEGPDADDALQALEALVNRNFDEA